RPQRRKTKPGLGVPLQLFWPEVPQLEKIAEEPARGLSNDDRVRVGDGLKARRQVWRFANDCLLLRSTRSDQVADHDQSGCNANTGLERNWRFERIDDTDQLQPSAHGSLGVVLVSLRVAE